MHSLPLDFESVVRCPLCRSADKTPRLQPPMIGGGRAEFVSCSGCGLVFRDPAPTPAGLDQFYASVYMTPEYRALEGFAIADPRQELAGTLKYMEHLADEVEAFRQPPGRILDAGCAFGGFLMEMRARGWECTGVEPFADAAAFCSEQLGIYVLAGGLDHAELPENQFDVITLWEVIEHLSQPVRALRRAASLARPGALLALTTPNPNSPAALVTGERWIGWKPPTHLCLFDFHTSRALLERTGWSVLRTHATGMYPGQITVFAERKQDPGV